MAEGAEAEREHARLGPQAVAVEGDRGVEDGGDGERGERVGRFGVGVFGRDACRRSVSWGGFCGRGWGRGTFSQAARERDGACQQDGEDAEGEEGEAQAAGEVDFERWVAVSGVHLWSCLRIHTCGFADFGREERDDHRGAGDEGRCLCCCDLVSGC